MAFLCYALLVAAWVVDLFTPQRFVAAILLNGPIALSSLALNRRLTTGLVVAAQIANAAACYVNGVQDHGQWDAIAVGDRILAGLSFILVGALAVKTQEYAREAGASSLREHQVRRERDLREAIERVRGSLSDELVLRGLVRESVGLLGAARGMLVLRAGLATPRTFSYSAGGRDVREDRGALPTELATLVERARGRSVVFIEDSDALGRLTLAELNAKKAVAAAVGTGDASAVLVLVAGERGFAADTEEILRHFTEQAAVALAQARLFERLATQNDEIARQRDEIARRGTIIRDIVYALAHDLRTPLAAADVTMRQALSGSYGELPERYRSVLKTTIASNDEERRLLETLLLVARYESGEASSVREPVDVNELARRVADEMAPLAESKGVSMASETAGEDVVVAGDGSELRRAVGNLAANALAATPAGGHVVIASGARNGTATVEVRDDGYGVPESRRATLFERFGHGPGGGTGLGLYIVRRIAEKHGGSVEYAPREPRGSAFTLTLERERGS